MKVLKISLIGVTLLLSGCASFDSNFTFSKNVNPDINGDPSPIAVNIFELSDPISFEVATFSSLYTDPQSVLGTTLLAQKSVVLAPGEGKSVSLPINKTATYLGYIAAYRNLNSVTWQAMVPVSPKGILGQSIDLKVTASGISVQNEGQSL